MFCKECGTNLADDAKFCIKCGTPTPSIGAEEIASRHQDIQPVLAKQHHTQPQTTGQLHPQFRKSKFEPYIPQKDQYQNQISLMV